MRAARNLGFVFSGRTPDSVIVEMVSEDKLDGSTVSYCDDGWILLSF